MALFIRQDENRTDLQKRLATDLQDKARKRAEEADLPDGVDDSQFVKGYKSTSSLTWLWFVIGGAATLALIIFIILTAR